MLPITYHQPYLTLRQTLTQSQLFIAAETVDLKLLRASLQAIKTQFQQQILSLDLDAVDPTVGLKLQSIQTEISKQLRLLEVDLLFLQTARQSATVQQRYTQISDRLTMLIRYCEMVLGTEEES
ncbi:MAG: heterocyst frequency control protein PatD [Oculatellaceae cyanobacterium bins.114]|nr:heterocyst frequency control protein PatD [Oculatellaceae cyanobacterium bins.114]